MARPELGTKRIDPENGRKFYDLGKDPIVSPYTGTAYAPSFFDPPAGAPSRRAAAPQYVHREEEPEAAETEEDAEAEDAVSLSDVEDEEAGPSLGEAVDGHEDDEAGDDEDRDDDRILSFDEDDDGEESLGAIAGANDED